MNDGVVMAYQCPACDALSSRALSGKNPSGRCTECGVVSPYDEWAVGQWRESARTTDTKALPGDIVGPMDDPFADDSVIVDTRRAVLLAGTDVALTVNPSDGLEFCALLMSGRVNRSSDQSRVVYLTGPDGMAALVTQLIGLAQRRGGDFANEFGTLMMRRMAELPTRPEGEG